MCTTTFYHCWAALAASSPPIAPLLSLVSELVAIADGLVVADKHPLQVQRQLQLRIGAQGKYLQKIIEEQQRINGAGVSRATSSEQLTNSERPNSSTHVPASPTPLQAIPFSEDNGSQVEPMKIGSQDIPNGEPQTPDTNCRPDSPRLGPKHERPAKRQRGSSNSDGTMFADGDFTLPHHIFDSSTGSEFQLCAMSYSSH
ncbi:myb family transcription factor PHL7-like [Miscanthus floridulus]|uniref:myb family transcription factor PHL7-like n=1 Tax=Miscanthus floridulus TaxID=154761 RepID=UPI003457DC34